MRAITESCCTHVVGSLLIAIPSEIPGVHVHLHRPACRLQRHPVYRPTKAVQQEKRKLYSNSS